MTFSLHGIPVSKGIAIGKAVLISRAALEVSHYLVELGKEEAEAQKLLGDFLCILVLVTDTQDTSLQYILENGLTNFSEWGQELVRSLSGEITTEYLKRLDESKPSDDSFGDSA